MPTLLTHAAVPLAIGLGLGKNEISQRLVIAGICASMLPDLDVLAFRFNIAYDNALGHRGASHSIVFALLIACVMLFFSRSLRSTPLKTFAFIFMSAVSHGLLDALTNGGKGVAFLWPFSTQRFFAFWQMIEVSPLSLKRILSASGLKVLASELTWVWVPAIALCALLIVSRLAFMRKSDSRTAD